MFGTQAQRNKLKMQFPLNVFGNLLQPANSVRNLGVMFDKDMLLTAHVWNICKGCFVQLRDFRHIRQFVLDECAILIANALVSSRQDYCNSLFRSLSMAKMLKPQGVQNTPARIVNRHTKLFSTNPFFVALAACEVSFYFQKIHNNLQIPTNGKSILFW